MYIHKCLRTWTFQRIKLPKGFTLLSHEIGLNQYPNVEERFIRNPLTEIALD